MEISKKTLFYPKMNLDRRAARVIFNKKKLPLDFSSKGSFLGGVRKNLIFNDQPALLIYHLMIPYIFIKLFFFLNYE